MRIVLFVLIVTMNMTISGCTLSMPFKDTGNYAEADTVVVGLTNARLSENKSKRDKFWDYSAKVIDSLESQPGFIGYSLKRTLLGKEVWTMTVWASEKHLNDFVKSTQHQQAISNGLIGIDQGGFARTTVERQGSNLMGGGG